MTAIAVGGLAASHQTETPATELVEGRVAVQIPAGWSVQRITGGPGSARVQVVSPVDPGAILHITQSRVPTADLAATADALRSAAAAQPPGVFVDFRPDDRRAGRPAVTYREVRPATTSAGPSSWRAGCGSASVVRAHPAMRTRPRANRPFVPPGKSVDGEGNQIGSGTVESDNDHRRER